jgi:hypothetical protein
MKTLGIAVQNNSNGSKEVVAREVDSTCTPLTGSTGDIEVVSEEQIRWMYCGNDWKGGGSYTFLATFEKGTSGEKWPFKPPPRPPDDTLKIPPPPAGPFDTTARKVFLNQEWKYSVDVDNDEYIDELDPMIIIRSKSAFATVALVVVATLLVVAAVYLLRRFLASR